MAARAPHRRIGRPGTDGIHPDAITGHIERLAASQSDGRIALVSHAEPIRTALLHYLGLPASAYTGIDIDPASVNQLAFVGNMRIAILDEGVSA